MIRNRFAQQAFAIRFGGFAVTNPACESGIAGARAEEADQPGRDDDDRKRRGEEEDRHERHCSQHLHRPAFQRTTPDPDNGVNDDRQHGGLETEECGRNVAVLAPFRIDDAQRHQRDDAGQDE
jgi:hypothetical protein